jgi:hypothetical protein
VLALLAAFFSGIGSNLADRVLTRTGPAPGITRSHGPQARLPLISSSTMEVVDNCTYDTFLPLSIARRVLERDPPRDWTSLKQLPGAVPVDRDIVEVSIQGESARVITLTGIRFQVTRLPRPAGERFSQACGGPWPGRSLAVDLDAMPPRITASSRDPHHTAGERGMHGQLLARPIRFPWTVSLTDPLLLYVFAGTRSRYCEWTAEITWVSGSRRGVIRVDDHGKPFKVVYGDGLLSHTQVEGGWLTEPAAGD